MNSAISRAGDFVVDQRFVEEDSEDWLHISEDGLDAKLVGAMQSKADDGMDIDANDQQDTIANAQAEKLKGLASKVEKFVEGEGDVEGAIFGE